jgi:hypothetical protein
MATRKKARAPSALHAELSALKAQVEKLEPALPIQAVKDAGADLAGEVEKLLGELRDGLGDTGEDLEEAIVKHPLTSIAIAFAIGYLIARMTGR